MLEVMVILFFLTLAGILANSIVVRYSSFNSVRVVTLLIIFVASIPLVILAAVVLSSTTYDSTTKMWALGVLAAIIAFWLKSPFRNARES